MKPKLAATDSGADTTTTTTPAAPALAIYEVLAGELKLGGVIAYRTARVNLSKDQADAINAAQADSLKFLGI